MLIRRLLLLVIFCSPAFISRTQCHFDPTIPGHPALCPFGTDTIWTQEYDSFQWYKDGEMLLGDTNQFLVITSADIGSYMSVLTTASGCSELSPPVLIDMWYFTGVSVYSDFYQVDQTGTGVICTGDSVVLHVDNSIDAGIQWTCNDLPITTSDPHTLVLTSNQETPVNYYSVCGYSSVCPGFLQCLNLSIPIRFADCAAGVSENIVSKSVNIYPNPFITKFSILFDPTLIGEQFRLVDGIGRIVLEGRLENNESVVDAASLSKGSYVLIVGNSAFKLTK